MASTSSSSTPALAKPKAASMQHLSSDKQLDRVPQEALQQINDVEGLKAFFELCEQGTASNSIQNLRRIF